MSRIPPRSPSKPPSRSLIPPPPGLRASSPSKPPASAPSPRARTKSGPKTPSKSRQPVPDNDPQSQKAPISIKEAIALKRAEAKKAVSKSGSVSAADFESMEDTLPIAKKALEDDDSTDLGRWSIKETIERARSTGSINLSTRSLPCLPSALFEIHLGITPDSLRSVPNEPPLSTTADDQSTPRRPGRKDTPAWFEAQDLQVLKAWSNEIGEIQHEISLFGSLRIVDLHNNKLVGLPDTFADLMSMTTLDLSSNRLTSLPSNLFALPNLTSLNISHNALTKLPFMAPFSEDTANSSSQSHRSSAGGGFFAPTITRASAPLPRLITLNASHNQLSAEFIEHAHSSLPVSLTKIDLSANPLGLEDFYCKSLLQAFGRMPHLRQLCLAGTTIDDNAFNPALFSQSQAPLFPKLRLLDLGETKVTAQAVTLAFAGSSQVLTFEVTTEDPAEGILRVILGKKMIKEPWEVETEKKAMLRRAKSIEQSLIGKATSSKIIDKPSTESVKEKWEIEAEQGLLTEGGRRRARAAAETAQSVPSKDVTSTASVTASPSTPVVSLASPQYFAQNIQTLTLPPSVAPSKSHSRGFSLASSSWNSRKASDTADLILPTPTLPLVDIASQPFAQTLRVLILANRRMDLSFSVPSLLGGESANIELLPRLEELSLEGCGLGDSVPVSYHQTADSGISTPPRSHEPLLPLLAKLFPSLLTLDLSYNALTTASLTCDALSGLILAATSEEPEQSEKSSRRGLKHLRLRGNRLTELDGFQSIAQLFRGNRDVPDWKLEELDLRENEIGKLPPELGLLPLDVFLVDGNLFRVPQRRVWEREGTKGLLSWLRGRIE